MTKGSKPAKPQGSPYKILYWMGLGVVVLLVGVVALALWFKPQPRERPDPDRILIWFYEDGKKDGLAVAAVVEESRGQKSLLAVPFIAPEQAKKAFAARGSRAGTDEVAGALQRKLHNRIFLPLGLVATMIDAAKGISVEGKQLDGLGAVAYIKEGGDQAPTRAVAVLLSMTQSIETNGVSIGISEGLRLARQIESSIELTSLPQVFERWKQYEMKIETPPPNDLEAIRNLLLADPPPPQGK